MGTATKNLVTAGLASLLLGSSLSAQALTVFTFEDGTTNGTAPILSASQDGITMSISAENNGGGPDQAWLYDSDNGSIGEDPDLEADFALVGTDSADIDAPSGKILIVQEDENRAPDDEAGGGKLILEFDITVELIGLSLIDSSLGNVNFEWFSDTAGTNSLGNRVNAANSDTGNDHTDNKYEEIVFGNGGVSGVRRLEITFDNVSGAVDNITVTAVPLPGAALLFLTGLGLLFPSTLRARK